MTNETHADVFREVVDHLCFVASKRFELIERALKILPEDDTAGIKEFNKSITEYLNIDMRAIRLVSDLIAPMAEDYNPSYENMIMTEEVIKAIDGLKQEKIAGLKAIHAVGKGLVHAGDGKISGIIEITESDVRHMTEYLDNLQQIYIEVLGINIENQTSADLMASPENVLPFQKKE